MRKALTFTLGLAALFGMTACVEQQEINPNFDPVSNTVNTHFVLNIAAADNPATKQPTTVPQLDGVSSFRGINNATLFVAEQLENGQPLDGQKILSKNITSVAFPLSQALEVGALTNTNSHRVMQLALPIGSNSMIFYGMATKKSVNGTPLTSEEAGQLVYVYPDVSLKHIGCRAASRLEENLTNQQIIDMGLDPDEYVQTRTEYTNCRNVIIKILNTLLKCGLEGSDKWNETHIEATNAYAGRKVSWGDYIHAVIADNQGKKYGIDGEHVYPLEQILGNAFYQLTEIGDAEARAGSAKAIGGQLRELVLICMDAAAATPFNDEERVAQQLFAVIEEFVSSFYQVNNSTWLPISSTSGGSIAAGLQTYGIRTGLTLPTRYQISDFPTAFHLPEGSAILVMDEASTTYPQYKYDPSPSHTGMSASSIEDITYAPELCYYCNSPIRVTDCDTLDNGGSGAYRAYPSSVADWSNPDKWTAWKDDEGHVGYGHILSSTRGVAMAFNVQYAMALLETNVSFGFQTQSNVYHFYDNNSHIAGHEHEEDQDIPVGGNSKLILKGIMIGGQPSFVNWMYLPWESVETDLNGVEGYADVTYNENKVVYDNDIYPKDATDKVCYLPMTSSAFNPTVVFDNWVNRATQNNVYIALELVNDTGKDFWGKDNLVRDGATFYLPLPALAPPTSFPWKKSGKDGDADVFTDEDNMTPPYYLENTTDDTGTHLKGETRRDSRVFVQDYATILNVALGSDALKNAMVTVPDLRASNVAFGISVDLTWKAGYTYNVPFGVPTGN